MPTYEYSCEACGYSFEKYEPMTAEPTKECPKCGKARAKRAISGGAGIIFKGPGFYSTDYRSTSYRDGAKKDEPKKEPGP